MALNKVKPFPILGCPVCGEPQSETWYDAGTQLFANDLLRTATENPGAAPLVVTRCLRCSHNSLTVEVPRERLYQGYTYRSGTSATFRRHCEDLWIWFQERYQPPPMSVLDIGANDGTLLDALGNCPGRSLVGVDCFAVAPVGTNMELIEGEFPDVRLPKAAFDVVATLNTLNAVPDLRRFAKGVAEVLKPGGYWIIEVPYLGCLIQDCAFDTIYHEHQNYWLLHPLRCLIELTAGMRVKDVQFVEIHGGTMRVVAQKTEPLGDCLPQAIEWLRWERLGGFHDGRAYEQFGRRVAYIINELKDFHRRNPGRWAAYGASAKLAMLLSTAHLDVEHIDYIVDDTPVKQGRFNPLGMPILPPMALMTDPPDFILCGAWNFKHEIHDRLRKMGCAAPLVVSLPKLEVLTG